MIFKKSMDEYNLFERIKINFNKLAKDVTKLKKICESDDYIFFKYKPNEEKYSTYILGQLKKHPKKVFMFGKNYDFVCVYKKNLFLCNTGGELNRSSTFVHRLDLINKTEENYNFRWKYSELIFIMGYGRFYTTDKYLKMKVEGDELVIYVHRKKSDDKKFMNDKENCDMDYKVVFKYENNTFVPFFRINDEDFLLVSD